MLYKVIDILLYIKYLIYFIFLINSLFFNYFYYKLFNNPNNFLLKILHFNINLNGAFAIKFVQWTITQFQFLDNSNSKYILNLFANFYENNYIHNINYTIFTLNNNLSFNFNDYFVFDNSFIIKSGSIAQIYKIKCINDINYYDIQFLKGTEYALKIIHPELKYQVYFFIKLIAFYKYIVNNISCFKKYSIFFDLENFINNLLLQFDMNNEFQNMKYFYETYNNNSKIIIPQPFISHNKLLIMQYIEGEYFNDLNVSNIKKQEIYCVLNLFFRDNIYYRELIHADLHPYNWKIINPDNDFKIVIYDYGYIIKILDKQSIIDFSYYHYTNNIKKMGELLYKYILDKNISQEQFNNNLYKYLNQNIINLVPFSNELISDIYNFLYIQNYKLNSELFDFMLTTLLQKYYVTNYISYNKTKFKSLHEYNLTINAIINNYSICKKYNIFSELTSHLNELLNDDDIKKLYHYENNIFNNYILNNDNDSNNDNNNNNNDNNFDI